MDTYNSKYMGYTTILNKLQVLDPSYGMYVWPCAPVLAQYIWYQREYIRGKRVLEVIYLLHKKVDLNAIAVYSYSAHY